MIPEKSLKLSNIFEVLSFPQKTDSEIFEKIISSPNLLIEKIISTGQITPPDQWYDQPQNEWVILLQGEAILTYENGSNFHLKTGDYLLIPSHVKHRVDYTSDHPPCIWLAIHFNLS